MRRRRRASSADRLVNVAVLGTGKLGSSLIMGWKDAGASAPASLRLYNPTRAKAEALADGQQISVFDTAALAVEGSDAVLLCMKPHTVAPVLENLRGSLPPRCLVISVAAGVKAATMEALLPAGQPVARALPTTAAKIRRSATAYCLGPGATEMHGTIIEALFGPLGTCVRVLETQLDGALGVASSGIAFAYLFLEALIDGGVRAGLPRDPARALAIQTLIGAAEMARITEEHPGALKDAVTTPGGTTIAGLEVLEAAGVRGAVIQAVRAAAERSRELG